MAWDHPHTATVKAGKGPKGKRQRRAIRMRAETERLEQLAQQKRERNTARLDKASGTLATIGWTP